MDIRRLRYFVAVATHLNFGRAATSLHTAQPSLSQQIKRLEEEVGAALFERTKRYVALTPLGEELLPAAKAIIEQIDELATKLKDRSAIPTGRLRIGAIAPATMGLLPRILPSFRQQFPSVELILETIPLDEQIRALIERRIDIGILRGPIDDALISGLRIADEYFCVMVESDHPLARERHVKVRDLDDVPLVGVEWSRAGSFNDDIYRLLNRHRVRPASFIETSDVQSVFALVASGMGACLSSTVFCDVAVKGITYRALSPKSRINSMMLACRRDRRDMPVIRALFEHVRNLKLQFPPPGDS